MLHLWPFAPSIWNGGPAFSQERALKKDESEDIFKNLCLFQL